MKLTKVLFKINDLIKGSVISDHYKQLIAYYKNKNGCGDALANLLKHAVDNVEFYNSTNCKNINCFPLVNKSVIKESLSKFQAQNYVSKKVLSMTTSGSTGTPFTVYQDLNKKARNHADTLYFGNLGGYDIGNKLWYLKIWVKKKMSSPVIYNLQNIAPIDVISLSEIQIKEIIHSIQTRPNKKYNILGYVSALELIIRYCELNSIDKIGGNAVGIITMSEGLTSETREKLEKLFNCSVVSRYSNLENGIIAQQLIGEDKFFVNTASYYVEILSQDSNEVVEDGVLGRIVVTDLYNYAMPMIRYDTGDVGSIINKDGRTYIERIEGRKLDVLFDTSGKVVSSYIMYKNMWQYNEIAQYQLIQTNQKSYLFKINCETQFTKESQLIGEFKKYLGEDADFKVEYVNEIPLLDSGKRRKTVNLYKTSIN
jgi:phenylacetate-CoA ligase